MTKTEPHTIRSHSVSLSSLLILLAEGRQKSQNVSSVSLCAAPFPCIVSGTQGKEGSEGDTRLIRDLRCSLEVCLLNGGGGANLFTHSHSS